MFAFTVPIDERANDWFGYMQMVNNYLFSYHSVTSFETIIRINEILKIYMFHIEDIYDVLRLLMSFSVYFRHTENRNFAQ